MYMFLPLNKHCDDGLGATGEAFEEAAKLIAEHSKAIKGNHLHLPINFLYRHAIELFLKSMITVLHRSLRVPYGDKPYDGPAFVHANGNWKRLDRVHSVSALWAYFRE